MCSWVSPPSMWTVVTRTMLDPSPTFPSMRETQAHHPPVILGSCRSVLTGSWTGRKRRRDRGVPCRGGPRRAAVLLDGQRPRAGAAQRGDRHRLRRRLPPRSRTYRYRLACDPAGPWGGKPLWNVDGDPVQIEWGPDLYRDYLSPAFSAATANRLGSTADIRGLVPRAGDLPAEEGAAATRAPREEEIATPVWPVLGSSLALHGASHGVDPLTVGRRGPGGLLRGAIRTAA